MTRSELENFAAKLSAGDPEGRKARQLVSLVMVARLVDNGLSTFEACRLAYGPERGPEVASLLRGLAELHLRGGVHLSLAERDGLARLVPDVFERG